MKILGYSLKAKTRTLIAKQEGCCQTQKKPFIGGPSLKTFQLLNLLPHHCNNIISTIYP